MDFSFYFFSTTIIYVDLIIFIVQSYCLLIYFQVVYLIYRYFVGLHLNRCFSIFRLFAHAQWTQTSTTTGTKQKCLQGTGLFGLYSTLCFLCTIKSRVTRVFSFSFDLLYIYSISFFPSLITPKKKKKKIKYENV